MRESERRFEVSGGAVSGIVTTAGDAAAATGTTVVLAHGAGSNMRNPLLGALAADLAAHGVSTVRFNFPYTQRGERVPDRAPILEACYRAVLEQVRADRDLRADRLVIGGKSMGGRMASHLAAAGERVQGLLFLGYPLHPAGKPDQLRAAHLSRISAPMLFLTGTRDALCRLDLLQSVLGGIPNATLYVIEDGDHSFAVRKRSGRDAAAVRQEIAQASVDWLNRTVGR